jgi:hypothetical protein
MVHISSYYMLGDPVNATEQGSTPRIWIKPLSHFFFFCHIHAKIILLTHLQMVANNSDVVHGALNSSSSNL